MRRDGEMECHTGKAISDTQNQQSNRDTAMFLSAVDPTFQIMRQLFFRVLRGGRGPFMATNGHVQSRVRWLKVRETFLAGLRRAL